ncbi:hypothetical protein A5724_09240 [Mycobacterium sp. ACS1612]|uniref:hypothetical protein n=1 Tax=Mycobacterium sp. ACS1612 TaxID=1834117 RepID=UPI0007FDD207|nr:hypothetical protein [Mycobacterium sp. ACS1612]OBF38690.1 hypothetical protein A5724_09240 [Mycobacterium sp. ACS1612]
MKSKQVKVVAASIGAGAAIAMAGLGLAFAGPTGGAGVLSEGPEVTLGETTTSTTAPSEPETTFVTPPVTAERPDGFAPGG